MLDARLKEWILQLLDSRIAEQDLQRLIQQCINLAKEMLRARHWRQMNILLREEFTAETLASRCIEELFLPAQGEPCREIRQYFRGLGEALEELPHEDAVVHLRRIVSVTVQQTVMELMGETDPVYRKIYRNVQDLLRESDAFMTEERFNETWIFRNRTRSDNRAGQEFPFDEFLTAIAVRVRPGETTQECLDAILAVAETSEQCSRGVRLHTTVKLLRRLSQLQYDARVAAAETEAAQSMETADLEELERRLEESAARVHSSTLLPYVKRGAIAEEHARRLYDAVRSYLRDILDGEALPLHEYYLEAFPDASYETYRATERARFEYVTKLARNHFLESCRTWLEAER